MLRARGRHDRDGTQRGCDRLGTDLPAVLDDIVPAAWHRTAWDANNRVETDHGLPKTRLRPIGGRRQDRSARVVIVGHALVQNLPRGHYELAVEEPVRQRLAVAFAELAVAI